MPSSIFTWTEEFQGQGVVSSENSIFTPIVDLGTPGTIPQIMKDDEARPQRIADREWSQIIDDTLYVETYSNLYIDANPTLESIGDKTTSAILSILDGDEGKILSLDGALKVVKALSKDLCEWDLRGLELLNEVAEENGIPTSESPEDLPLFWDRLSDKVINENPLAPIEEVATGLVTALTLVIIAGSIRLINLECSWRVVPDVGRVQDRAQLFKSVGEPMFNMYLHHPDGINIGFPSLAYGDAPNMIVNGVDPIYLNLGKTYAGASYDVRYAGTENSLYLNGVRIAPLDLPSNFGGDKQVRYPTQLLALTTLALRGDEVKNYLETNGEAAIHPIAYDRFSVSIEMWYPKEAMFGVLKVLTQNGWRRA